MRVARAAVVALALTGCTTSIVSGYVERVAAATTGMTSRSVAVLPPGAEPTRLQVAAVVETRRAALEALEAVSPPEQFAPEHLALVTALRALVTAADGFLADTAGLDGAAFHDALAASTEIDLLADAVAAACGAWERRASDLDHATELGC